VEFIPLNDDKASINCAQPIVAQLRANMVRVDTDFSATPFKAKIATAEHRESFPPPRVGGYGSSSAVAIPQWRDRRGERSASTTAARKVRSRRRRSWRTFWRAFASGGHKCASQTSCLRYSTLTICATDAGPRDQATGRPGAAALAPAERSWHSRTTNA